MNELFGHINPNDILSSGAYTYLLVTAAELGDKSQLVCMTLAARYRAIPVFVGALLAFIVLNLVAVLFGSALSLWIAPWLVSLLAGLLFLGFGAHAMLAKEEDDEQVTIKNYGSILVSTFLLITLAELGDKTQLAVIALASTHAAWIIWLGATLALATTSALGVWAGKTILTKLPVHRLHQFSGLLFMLFGMYACYQAYQMY